MRAGTGRPPAMAAANSVGEGASPPLAQLLGPRLLRLKTLASGSFGTVVLHWDQLMEKIVCVKQPLGEDAAASFIREIVTYSRLGDHPNVMVLLDQTIGDPGAAAGVKLVMPFYPSTLDQLWKSAGGCLEFASVRHLSRGLLRGVAHLHSSGFAHRDLSMRNLLVASGVGDDGSKSFELKITDLGAATILEDKDLDGAVTTLSVRPPEMVAGLRLLRDPPSSIDLWSSGVVLASLWIGQSPFPIKMVATPGLNE